MAHGISNEIDLFSTDPKEIENSKLYGSDNVNNKILSTLIDFVDSKGIPDGVIVEKANWDAFDSDENTQIIVFSPTQIKSATANRGTFDADNPDIRFSKAPGEKGDTVGRTDKSTFSRGNGSGMALRDLSAVVDRVGRGLKNLPKVHVLESPDGLSTKDPAQKALRDFIRRAGAWEDVEGATHEGEIYLFASGIADEARAEHVLATHEITHYGLRGALGKGLDAALQHVWMNNQNVRKAAAALKARNKLASNIEATEEVLADMPTAELATLKGWRRVVGVVRDWLQKIGAKNLAARLDGWLKAGLDEQAQADLFVADLVRAAREWVRSGKGSPLMAGTRLADGLLSEDVTKQEKWLTAEAKARGYRSIDDLAERNYPLFEKLAALWRKKNPADALLSRALSLPLVSPRSQLEAWIGGAISNLNESIKGDKASLPMVALGRAPHVFGAIGSKEMDSAKGLFMLIDATVQNKAFFGKHAEDMRGVTPAMLVRALYRPAMVVADRAQRGNCTLVTNILTEKGPVVINVDVTGQFRNAPAMIVNSAYPRENGVVADWLNGKHKDRDVLYVDADQMKEAVTGKLNPESTNPTFAGWDLVSGSAGINTVEHNARAATPVTSDKPIIAKFGAPANNNYRGLATIVAKLEQRLSGRGMPKVKTREDLLRWIENHHRGEAAERPRFSRATAAQAQQSTAAERADAIIAKSSATWRPVDAVMRGITTATRLDKATGFLYDKAGSLLDRFTPERVKAGVVSDYGVPEAVIDRRVQMQGAMRRQLFRRIAARRQHRFCETDSAAQVTKITPQVAKPPLRQPKPLGHARP
ncbi:MAG: hypothetical protein J0M01_15275 [Dechloromonas sp.]|nr:hypothetical protein [Dechloromonas sp.]